MSEQVGYSAGSPWDAGTKGCGIVLMELKKRLSELKNQEIFYLKSSAPEIHHELKAWCGMTGNKLLQSAPPHYKIQKQT